MAKQSRPWYRASKATWYITVEGKKVSLGVRGQESEAEAIAAWHRLMANGEGQKAKQPEVVTVGEVIVAFLGDAGGRVKAKTIEWYAEFLNPFATRFGNGRASALTAHQAENYARKPTWSDSTRHDFLGVLVSVFKWAERAGVVASNPLQHVRKPAKASRGDKALISAEEYSRLVEAASRPFCLFLTVLHATGARPGEVAAITAENFDAATGVVHLRDHKTAHLGKRRILYLPPPIVALLVSQREVYPSGALLRTRMGNPWGHDVLVHEMARLRRRVAVPHATLYGFRHSFATDALANGVPDAQVAALLGHSGTAMLHRHYSHLTAQSQVLREALKKVR
jgi:integrase